MYNNLALLIGHLLGDYVFQTEFMAVNKSKKGMDGFSPCMAHCIVYSFCVAFCVLMGGWRTVFYTMASPESKFALSLFVAMLVVFITHYPIDRYGLASKWLRTIGQSDFESVKISPNLTDEEKVLRRYFIAPVYMVVDNTLHIFLMWLVFSFLGN